MSLAQSVNKPKTRAGKRFLIKKQPKLIENDKKTIFIRGVNANNVVLQAMKDFAALKKPNCVFFNKKNDIKPFEDATSLEFFCQKSDAALFMFGSHNKKRPNNLVVGRMFDSRVLDMFELGIEGFRALKEFKTAKVATGSKPMLMFTEGFDQSPEYKRLKNFFIDFFRGPEVDFVNLKGLEHLLVFALNKGKIQLRSYRAALRKIEGEKSPSIDLADIGPNMDFTLKRSTLASEDLFKQSCKTPKQLKPTKVKNMKRDNLGSTQGRVHMERQDYDRLQTRKMKGLKGKRKPAPEESSKDSPSKKMKVDEA